MEILFSFLGGFVLMAIAAFFVTRSIVRSRVSQAEQSAKLQSETVFAAKQTKLESELEHEKQRAEDLRNELDKAKEETQRQVQLVKEEWIKRNKEDIASRDAAHKEAMDALQKRFDETIEKVSAQVKNDTGEMLKARQIEFSKASNESIGQLVNPLKENIAELRKAMEADSKEQAERSGEMRQQIKNLMEHSDAARKSADELAAAFKHGSKVQGDWGESILGELLSSQGLTEGIHFDTQAVIRTSDGKTVKNQDGGTMRPDVILHLDSIREVIIDSKVSLTAYINYVNAENETERDMYLKAHLDSVKKHVKELADKDYSSYIQSPKVSAGYVIMFVPMAGALWTALNAEPNLWRNAAENNVYITDEQSLFGALKILKITWTQIIQEQNHQKVFELANTMIERVGMFMEKYDAIGDALNKASAAFTEGKSKLAPNGQSIITTANQLIELGAKNSKKHPIKGMIDVADVAAIQSATDDNTNIND